MNTITPSPLAVFKGQVGARTWNLLIRHGLSDLTTLRQALADGLAPGDYKGLGQVALLEIRLALDNTPADAPEPAPEPPESTSPAPAPALPSVLTERELTILLALAEAGLDHVDTRVTVNEALMALGHLRQLAGEDEIGDLYPAVREQAPQPHGPDGPDNDPWPPERPRRTEPAPGPDPSWRNVPEPVDDSFEGYVIDAKPGWGSSF